MSKKRKLERGVVDLQLVDIYNDLAHERGIVRLQAAESLLSRLAAEPHIRAKVLQRLVRGLDSGRKSARVGFSVALTEFCRLYVGQDADGASEFSISKIIDTVEGPTQIGNDTTGHEIRDRWYGRLFGAGAILQSGVLFNGDIQYWDRVVSLVLDIASKKVWLRQESGWLLYQAVGSLKKIAQGGMYVTSLLRQLHDSGQERTPEAVAILVAAQKDFPDATKEAPHFSFSFSSDVASILGWSDSVIQSENTRDVMKSNGVWFPKPHFAWDVVLKGLLEHDIVNVEFGSFWQRAVEDGLFNFGHSAERTYWGFYLFRKWSMLAPSRALPALFGRRFVEHLRRELVSPEKYLNAMALDVVDALTARTIEDKDCIPNLVSGFLNADPSIDRQSRAKPVEKLIGHADIEGLRKIVSDVTRRIDHLTKRKDGTDMSGLSAFAEVLVSMLRTHNLPNADSRKVEEGSYRDLVHMSLKCFARHAFSGGNLSKEVRDMFKQRLMSSLNLITAKDSNMAYFPCRVVESIKNLESKNLNADPQVIEAIAQGTKLLEGIEDKERSAGGAQQSILQAFQLLLAFALLQAYAGEAESVNTIDDLQNCFKSLVKRKNKTSSEKSDAVLLVEIIVEFISKPSALYRRLAPKILAPFAPQITEDGLQVMTSVLLTSEDASGQASLFAQDGEEDVASNAESSSGSSAGDAETEDAPGPAQPTSASHSSSADSSSNASPSSPTSDADAELAAFDAALASALRTSRSAPDAASASSGEDHMSDMSDSAMEALDAQLGQIFRQKIDEKKAPTPKQQRRGARDTMLNFKTKILELLETYIKSEARNPVALSLVQPLIRAIAVTGNRKIAEKEGELVRTYTRAYKLKPRGSDAERQNGEQNGEQVKAEAWSLLESVHEMVHHSTSQLQAKACSSASLLATKVYLTHGGTVGEVKRKYAETAKTLETKKENKFRACFGEDWTNWLVQAEKEGQLAGRM